MGTRRRFAIGAHILAAVPGLWFTTHPVQAGFFDAAPFRLQDQFDIPRPASAVWSDLTTDKPGGWCRILRDITWTSPRPFGIGTTRTVRTVGGIDMLSERFFRWEEGRRQSFYVLKASSPLYRRFAEDHLVEPTSETSCRFTWTIAMEPRRGARITNFANRLVLETLFRDTRKHYGIQ